MSRFEMKFVHSCDKCFANEKITDKKELRSVSMMKNERLNVTLAYGGTTDGGFKTVSSLVIESELLPYVKVSRVENVPVAMPAYPTAKDDDYLRTEPGLYPDLLLPFEKAPFIIFVNGELRSALLTVECEDGIPAGVYTLKAKAVCGEEIIAQAEISVTVIGAMLPESELIYANWFHYDCLSTYYNVPVFSEEHWEIIGKFAAEAYSSGVNMILTPVFTPPLDTDEGGERPTVQLIEVYSDGNNYSFGYGLLDRFVGMMRSIGFRYFEISHLFTQWGAKHAPKIMAHTAEGEKRIFGWDTDAGGEEYTRFIRTFLKDFIAHVKKLGIDRDCWYHISDEPGMSHLADYTARKNAVADLLAGYNVIDTLSDFEFYRTGAVERPIPALDRIMPFIDAGVTGLWTYYCCAQNRTVSNRFVAMPGQRTRIIGYQLYKYGIGGFLHWGFNFYYCGHSLHPVNPFAETCGEYFVPAGDAFTVYPGIGGEPYRTLHGIIFTEALTDLRALRLCEKLIGRERTLSIVESEGKMTVNEYPKPLDRMIKIREKINKAIADSI